MTAACKKNVSPKDFQRIFKEFEHQQQNILNIISRSDSNVIRTHDHLVRTRTLNYLAILAK